MHWRTTLDAGATSLTLVNHLAMSTSVRVPAVVNQNCLHLLDISSTRAAAEHWIMHHCQWASAHSTITETFKVVPQICEFLDQLFTTLSRLKTAEAVNQVMPRVWEVLSRLASNVALLVHKAACEKLLKCIDIFVSDMPEAASEVRRKAHAWATRLLHGIAKILDQVNDLSAWEMGSGQMHYDMTDLIRDARTWVDSEQSYFVSADQAPRDLPHLFDTCLLFLCLRKPSAIISHVLACIGKLPGTNAAEVAAFLDQASRLLSHSSGYEDDFWSTVRAALWECHTAAFESAVVDYATGCATRQQCLSSSTYLARDRLDEQNLIEACARSYVLCYRATMMLRQLRLVADGSHCAAIPLCHFHLFLKDYIYKLGSKASFDIGCVYAGYLTEAAAIATTPVTAYRNVHVLKSRVSALAAAVVRAASAAATHSASFIEFSDEVRCLMVEQHDWYWAAAILSASTAATDTEIDDYLTIMVVTHLLSPPIQCTWSSGFMSDLQKQKAEIRAVLENARYSACIEEDEHVSQTVSRKDSSRDRERLPMLPSLAVLDVILLLRLVLVGSPEDLIRFLCKLSSSRAVNLGVIVHVLQMMDVEYWKAVGVLSCTAMHCIKTTFERCVKAVVDSQPGAVNERSTNAPCMQAAIDLQKRYADTYPNDPHEKAVLAETTSCGIAPQGDETC